MSKINLGTLAELAGEAVRCVEHAGQQYVLVYHQGEFHLLDNLCPHKAAALCDGDVRGAAIECPWHKARFDLQTGRGLTPLAGNGVNTYPVAVEGDCLWADLN